MMRKSFSIKIFSATSLKILACAFMLCDHIGFMFFKDVLLLRVLGRLAFPLFAFFIAEGCRYTKNKTRRVLSVFILGVICELFYLVFTHTYYGNILLTFSVSILLIYLFDALVKSFLKSKWQFVLLIFTFALSTFAVYFYCSNIGLDYGFFGVISPVLAYVPYAFESKEKLLNVFDKTNASLLLFAVGLFLTIFSKNALDYQACCLCALPLLALYNGRRGRFNLKYAFYLFYPLHLALLQLIQFLIDIF